MIGRRLSHYQIVDEISRGGMGVVYRAIDVRLNREVAVKVLPEDLVADADRRRRFVHEAQAASSLEHPHIAVIHEIDEADGVTFIAMELVRGDKLTDVIARRRLPPARTLELAVEIAEGLARAHDKNIVHRDLKPANVMLTEDGHAKVIDFGLAKLIEPEDGYLGATETGTGSGVVLGTLSYMSPEQAAGDRVDHRTDVFAFGVLLYEMLSGARPFDGRTGIDTLHAIINGSTPSLPDLGPTVLPDAGREIERIVDKCLAKDPADRYQGMRDLVVDLRAARRLLESGPVVSSGIARAAPSSGATIAPPVPAVTTAGPAPTVEFHRARARWILPGVAVVTVVAAIAALLLWNRRAAPLPTTGSKPSVAVLFFENNTGNASLDWLRAGLTDMVVTDLSQLPDIEVMSTDRLHRILDEMNRADDKVISADVVDAVARKAGVRTVLLGSYMKAGETIRINVKLQEANTGRLVSAERVEGVGEANLFSLVDDLTRRIRDRLLPRAGASLPDLIRPAGQNASAELDRGVKDVTTASIEAYRYYSEGINLHQRLKEREAVPLLQKALEIDPQFAMALAKLAIVSSNLARPGESLDYARRALAHADRLTNRERLYVEGVYYTRRPDTVDKAIAAYRKAIELYPDHEGARMNLALIAADREKDDEVIEQLEELRRLGGAFPSTFSALANAYARKGDTARGYDILQEYIRRFPDSAVGHAYVGNFLVARGRLDEGAAELDKAAALGAAETSFLPGRYAVGVLRERWTDANDAGVKLTKVGESFPVLVGWFTQGCVSIFAGRMGEAVTYLQRATERSSPPFTAFAYTTIGYLRLDRGDLPEALAAAERAIRDAKDLPMRWPALGLAAIVETKLGRNEAADARLRELRKAADTLQIANLRREAELVAGEVALARRDTKTAIDVLSRADAMLHPESTVGPPTQHVRIWYALALAQLEAGNRAEAARWFQRIVDSTVERVYFPLQVVRSHYFLGKIAEESGNRDQARAHYQRFVDYWKGGEMDRERVAEAAGKTGLR